MAGIKRDRDTGRLSRTAPSSKVRQNPKLLYKLLYVRQGLRKLFHDTIEPKINYFLGDRVKLFNAVCKKAGIPIGEFGANVATVYGRSFYPRAHVDDDIFFSVLAAMDLRGGGPEGGANFVFPTFEQIVALRAGDILLYNPTVPHGSTEAKNSSMDTGRKMIAHYTRSAILKAALCMKLERDFLLEVEKREAEAAAEAEGGGGDGEAGGGGSEG